MKYTTIPKTDRSEKILEWRYKYSRLYHERDFLTHYLHFYDIESDYEEDFEHAFNEWMDLLDSYGDNIINATSQIKIRLERLYKKCLKLRDKILEDLNHGLSRHNNHTES